MTSLQTYDKVIEVMNSPKTNAKKLEGLTVELKTFYFCFDEAFRLYKADVIGKDCANIRR